MVNPIAGNSLCQQFVRPVVEGLFGERVYSYLLTSHTLIQGATATFGLYFLKQAFTTPVVRVRVEHLADKPEVSLQNAIAQYGQDVLSGFMKKLSEVVPTSLRSAAVGPLSAAAQADAVAQALALADAADADAATAQTAAQAAYAAVATAQAAVDAAQAAAATAQAEAATAQAAVADAADDDARAAAQAATAQAATAAKAVDDATAVAAATAVAVAAAQADAKAKADVAARTSISYPRKELIEASKVYQPLEIKTMTTETDKAQSRSLVARMSYFVAGSLLLGAAFNSFQNDLKSISV